MPLEATSQFAEVSIVIVKMKFTILASLLAGAAAFAPAKVSTKTTALNAFEDELGAQPPLGFFETGRGTGESFSNDQGAGRRRNEVAAPDSLLGSR